MSDHNFRPNRRAVVAGLTAAALQAPNSAASAEEAPRLALRCRSDVLRLREKGPATEVWSLGDQPLRFKRGDRPEITLANDLPVPIVLNWRGVDGVAAVEPLLVRSPLAPSASDSFRLPPRHAGTYLCDPALLGDGAARPFRAVPLIVSENEPVRVDRDEVFLIEGWRLKPDGSAIAPGLDPDGTVPVYTVNGALTPEIRVRGRERLRMRFINALPRHVIALKIEHYDVTVMALDSQPAEPFLARGGALALAPGGRADVFIDVPPAPANSSILMHDGDAARPIAQLVPSDEAPVRSEILPASPALPSNGLPARLELKSALRVDLPFGGEQKDWLSPVTFASTVPPAFRAKAGRTVVLSLINRASMTSVFHLHGHHFRLLDRLDDGWKPFWLDTIAIDAGQTQRIAFAAEYAGRWPMEAVETNWSAPRLLRWYSVE
ncbi:multicopper oxidase family protein [Bradyrhizobium sp.]|uniref:multicopper oxidase family protein n=1 Tax=Bradyrhizobium sp. TaxID=376 RepID=UPI003C669523